MFLGHHPTEFGKHLGNVVIEMFDNNGQLNVRVNFPAGDGKGGITTDQRDYYIAALQTAIRNAKEMGRGNLTALVGPGGDIQGPLPLRNDLG